MTNELYRLSATAAIEGIKEGRITAVELVESCLGRIRKIEPQIHAWSFLSEEIAKKQAQEIDRQIKDGSFKGELYGIPVGIKDIYNTEDMPTEMGSIIWKRFNPGNDARCVFNLKYDGAVVLGKTVTAEFAVHYPGPTVNPHNFEHTPGTSSSGSAAAVACSMVPLAIGSQTAGSTIRPASYCGIYGFKPTFGLIPRTGVLKTVDVLDHVTLFSRTIEDALLGFNIMRVKGHNYPFVQRMMESQDSLKKTLPWKIAFIKTHLWDTWEEYAKEAMINFISEISKNKEIVVEEVKIPEELKSAHEIHDKIYNKSLSYYYNPEYTHNKEQLSKVFVEMLEKGMKTTTEEYVAALHQQEHLSHVLDRFFQEKGYDGIITLSTAGEAQKGLHSIDKKDSCLIWTLCGAPSINLPVFTGPNNLPFGAQVVFRKYKDFDLFNFLKLLKQKKLINDINYVFRYE